MSEENNPELGSPPQPEENETPALAAHHVPAEETHHVHGVDAHQVPAEYMVVDNSAGGVPIGGGGADIFERPYVHDTLPELTEVPTEFVNGFVPDAATDGVHSSFEDAYLKDATGNINGEMTNDVAASGAVGFVDGSEQGYPESPKRNSADGIEGEAARRGRQSKSGSVKFTEPLNNYTELESKYEEVLGKSRAAELHNLEEQTAATFETEMQEFGASRRSWAEDPIYPSAPRSSNASNVVAEIRPMFEEHAVGGGGVQDPFGEFEITPEDIFNEIKVAHAEKAENEGAQNLHSYIISKSYSSENVVVLLNLRRLKDGEWVLDKTIAQGLKPETYGGVVSIDQYGFTEAPSEFTTQTQSLAKMEESVIDVEPDEGRRSIMETLKKMEDFLANVNKELGTARDIVKKAPVCRDDPCTMKRMAGLDRFEELPLTDQVFRMLASMVSEENDTCNLCDDMDLSSTFSSTNTAIKHWLADLIADITEFFQTKLRLSSILGLKSDSSAVTILAHSSATLDPERHSGLINLLNNKQIRGSQSLEDSIATGAPVEEDGTTDVTVPDRLRDEADINRSSNPDEQAALGTLEINIESKASLEQFLRENDKSL